jgi:hypothetical protein
MKMIFIMENPTSTPAIDGPPPEDLLVRFALMAAT